MARWLVFLRTILSVPEKKLLASFFSPAESPAAIWPVRWREYSFLSSLMVRYFLTAMSTRATLVALPSNPIWVMNRTAAGESPAGGS